MNTTEINLLQEILKQQKHMAESLQRIADCMVYLANEQIADNSATSQLRWLGDGLDDPLQ